MAIDKIKKRIPMLNKKIAILLSWLLVGLIVLMGCASAQQTPQKEKKYGGGFNFFSESAEISLGKEFSQEVENELPILNNYTITSYVDRVGQNLADVCKRPNITYHFKVVDVEDINAFALPGGYIYVNRGLIEAVERESELAAVIGHEIGHVVGRHGTKQLSKRLLLAGIVIGTSALISQKSEKWGQIAETAGAMGMFLGMMKYSRDDEREADYLGLHNIYDAGYDPQGMVHLFQIFQEMHKREPNKLELLFATHPPPSERMQRVNAELLYLDYEGKVYGDSSDFRRVKRLVAKLPPPAKGIKKKIVVPATLDWIDTGIELRKGQKIEFYSDGEICLKNEPGNCCSPDGIAGRTSFWATMEAVNLGALIGKIGDEGEPFLIGSQKQGTIYGGGRLYLGINDSIHNDNSGYFNVTVVFSIR